MIIPGKPRKDAIGVSFAQLVGLFPNSKRVDVYWPLFAEDEYYFQRLPSSECLVHESQQPTTTGSVTAELHIRAIMYDWGMENQHGRNTNHHQLGDLLRQFQFLNVRSFFLRVGESSVLEANDREASLAHIINACNELRLPDVTDAKLDINLRLDGRTKDVNACVSARLDQFQRLLLTC
jgi:hypothetical protein